MRGVNKVIIVGNLGGDPTVTYMPSGDCVASISVATSEAWKDKQTGEKKEKAEWHKCVAYKKQAEIIAQYLKKGSKVYIEGKLETKKWHDEKHNVERYSTNIIIASMQMLDSRKDDQTSDMKAGMNAYAEASGHITQPSSGEAAPFDDDIPF